MAPVQGDGDIRARDRLIFSLAPIVKHIVYRKVRQIPAYREVDDFLSCGIEALLRAIDRYDPDKGATLEQYAWTRIHGAVIDELRRYDWAPRSVRRLEREMNRARERFTVLHGRVPTRTELSEALAISQDELDALLEDLARCEVGSLNTLVIGDDDSPSERLDTLASLDLASDPEHAAMREGAIERFREAFDRAPAARAHASPCSCTCATSPCARRARSSAFPRAGSARSTGTSSAGYVSRCRTTRPYWAKSRSHRQIFVYRRDANRPRGRIRGGRRDNPAQSRHLLGI